MPKFVKWVPTPSQYIEPFFELAPVSSSDIIYDLGSGDGRLLIAALEKGGGKCVGIELDPECVNASRETAKNKGLDEKLTFIEGDVMGQNLSDASIILCYILGSASAALRPKFEDELKSGTRVVMESFPVPGWKPAKTKEINGRTFYLYIMPPEKTEDYDSDPPDTAYEYEWFYWP
ncbi:MAG: class I SAM-dependent methyltransferase [Chloroflexi bacterium]|nr:class I SAM-dependent methyltransferase [Chloroflexota bacterium]